MHIDKYTYLNRGALLYTALSRATNDEQRRRQIADELKTWCIPDTTKNIDPLLADYRRSVDWLAFAARFWAAVHELRPGRRQERLTLIDWINDTGANHVSR